VLTPASSNPKSTFVWGFVNASMMVMGAWRTHARQCCTRHPTTSGDSHLVCLHKVERRLLERTKCHQEGQFKGAQQQTRRAAEQEQAAAVRPESDRDEREEACEAQEGAEHEHEGDIPGQLVALLGVGGLG
jgi:hypothetical protein